MPDPGPADSDVQQLLSISSDLESVARKLSRRAPVSQSEAERVRLATAILRTRTRRAEYLPGLDFGEPAWDMLLDLFVAGAAGVPISVSSLCQAARVPHTTALRWVSVLTEAGYIARERDQQDGRRIYTRLTDHAREAVAAWLDDAAAIGL
jgi:DNA-binding MarR family transcriptional regulator